MSCEMLNYGIYKVVHLQRMNCHAISRALLGEENLPVKPSAFNRKLWLFIDINRLSVSVV